MRHLSAVLLCSLFSLTAFAADEDCDCPKLSCDPCMFEQGKTFYSEKCGPENSKVRSCTRPTCVMRTEPTEACPKLPVAKGESAQEAAQISSLPAVDPVVEPTIENIGQIKVIQGSVAIVRANGEKILVQQAGSGELREKDSVETPAGSAAMINFKGGNRVHVHPQTQLEVQEFKDVDESATRRVLLHLVRGKIRNQVEQKYNGKTSYYHILTREAVAGVRGTDFIVEELPAVPGIGPQTRVETLKGVVSFSSLNETQSEDIHPGEGAKFANGILGAIYKMTDDQIHNLDLSSRVDIARAPKSEAVPDRDICTKPAGKFNQCVWRCVGNPSGESTCRTDRAGVHCLRERCNGNGQWADPTPLVEPSSCPTSGNLVKDCDY